MRQVKLMSRTNIEELMKWAYRVGKENISEELFQKGLEGTMNDINWKFQEPGYEVQK